MSIKDILVHLSTDDRRGLDPAVRYGLALAARFGAHATGLILASQGSGAGDEGAAPERDGVRTSQEATAAQASEAFLAEAGRRGVGAESLTAPAGEGSLGEAVAAHARLRDLTVLSAGEDGEGSRILEDLLRAGGRPAILVPEEADEGAGEHVLVAYDGTPAAARALADARPLLAAARAVTVVTVADEPPAGFDETARALTTHLGRHGIRARALHLPSLGRDIGDALVHHARELGADHLVMGAFAHSRLRRLVLGGATEDILAGCPFPVLLSR